jgi:hypothetical protein
VTTERGRRLLLGALFAGALVAVVAVLPPLVQTLSGEPASRGGADVAAGPTVRSIRGIEALRTAFNEDAGRVRLYLLLSPT